MMEKEGMTQIQLAQKMGITRQRVCRLISGNMRYENFARIVKAAGYDVKIENAVTKIIWKNRAKLLTNTQLRVILYT